MTRCSNRFFEVHPCAWLMGYAAAATIAASVSGGDVKTTPQPPPKVPDIKTVTPRPFKVPYTTSPALARSQTLQPQPAVDKPTTANGGNSAPLLVFTEPLFDEVDGSHWVRGQSYKAQFNTDGMTFIPFLGADAPRNYPVHLSLESISVGSQFIPLERTAPQRVGQSITFNRGAVQETYHIALNSIEQTFVLHERPAELGKLTVRIAVTTDLTKSSTGDSLQFFNGRGTVKYSHAILVDAVGTRTNLPTTLNAGNIEIKMPESVLSSAIYPITIDPIFHVEAVENSSQTNRWSDLAYDYDDDGYLIVWENQYSVTDGDIYCRRYDWAGFPTESAITIDFTSDNWRRPRVANNNLANNYLVVAERGAAPLRSIWGRTRDSSTTVMSSQFQITDTAPQDRHSPDVGGDPALVGPTYYFVVWTRVDTAEDRDVHARMVNSNGTLFGGVILVDNGTADDVTPSISNSNGLPPFATQNWTIVWARSFNPFDSDISMAQYRWDGVETIPSWWVDISSNDTRNPSVSSLLDEDIVGSPRRFMVVYDSDDGFSDEGDIYAKVFRLVTLVTEANLTALEGVATTASRRNPVVDSTSMGRFVVAHQQQFTGNDWDAYISQYCLNGTALKVAEPHRNLAYTPSFDGNLSVAGARVAGNLSYGREFMATWTQSTASGELGFIIEGMYGTRENSCCPEDVTDDGQIGVPDLLAVINDWSSFCLNCSGDIQGDLAVGVPDLLRVINAWGPCP